MTEPQSPIYLADGMPRRTFLKTLGIASGSLMLSGLPSLQAQTGQSATDNVNVESHRGLLLPQRRAIQRSCSRLFFSQRPHKVS